MVASILERAGRRIGPAGTADAARGRRLLVMAGWTALLTVNFILLAVTLAGYMFADANIDWILCYAPAADKVFSGGLYAWVNDPRYSLEPIYVFRYSPVAAWLFAGLVPLGPVVWTALHFPPLLALPRRLAVLVLLSAPFWNDVYNGNIQTFIFVAAVAALSGSRLGTVSFFALALLAPKPIMLPVLAWLLWKRPETRAWFLGIFLVHAALVLASGYGPEWIASFLRSGDDFANRADMGPARIIGSLWIPVGFALAVFFTIRGRLGLASMAASPYWLLHYWLFALLETRPASSASTP